MKYRLSIILLFAYCLAQTQAEKSDHWSLQKVTRPALPKVENPNRIRSPIDAFIFAKLHEADLEPAPEAARRVLMRRVYFDLIGLPPTPKELQAFLADSDPKAYEKLVDKLLASPQYGERWARHWLDIAHYADTHGFERDRRRDHAWPYRDYVIRSFNEDKPYDRFILEQIAGDLIDPHNPDAVIATGFLAAGPWDFVGQKETQSQVLKRQARADDLDNMVTQVMTATMGLTVNCARCHDHKIDPIPQKDYYRLWAVFSDLHRGDRNAHAPGEDSGKQKLSRRLAEISSERAKYEHPPFDLSDAVGGGNGFGSGQPHPHGIDPRSGRFTNRSDGYLTVKANQYTPVPESPFVDGVVVPDGKTPVPISSTGLQVKEIPPNSGKTWDHVLNGPVNSQGSTLSNGLDYHDAMLGLHANKAVTFDLNAIRQSTGYQKLHFTSMVGYGGKNNVGRADFRVFIDGKLRASKLNFGHQDGGQPISLMIEPNQRFLTLMSTDAGNSISHDQIYFGHPRLTPMPREKHALTEAVQAKIQSLRQEEQTIRNELKKKAQIQKVYAVNPEKAVEVHVLKRGNPEEPLEVVTPGGLSLVEQLSRDFKPDQKRKALAEWIVHPDNPLTGRVLVNRLWQYHFGTGLVHTPSDFGKAGGTPSHPALLDWLADEFQKNNGSIKAMHRLMVNSSTYRQAFVDNPVAHQKDAENRLLWRMNPRRLEAESIRDSVLAVTGKLNPDMYGPGFQDFNYREAYAPEYTYITQDKPALWRRSIYRYTVRSVPSVFMNVLDCPNPSSLTPKRNQTTTALQALSLMNNDFMIRQARYFAQRVQEEAGANREAQIEHAFALAFSRKPQVAETQAALKLDLFDLCRGLFNANEFIYVD